MNGVKRRTLLLVLLLMLLFIKIKEYNDGKTKPCLLVTFESGRIVASPLFHISNSCVSLCS